MDNNIAKFKCIAQKRWEYLEKGDSKNGNKCFDELTKLVSELKIKNELDKLIALLEDTNDGVKFETASKLLLLYPTKAEPVLEHLANKRGILPFAAKQTLKQWKAGKIEL